MSRKLNKTNKKGFTLIEVVLVLAIGGLIFLLAFIAFRNASVNRRDGVRRADASRFVAEMDNYLGDSGATTPPSNALGLALFVNKYIDANWSGPSGKAYRLDSDTSGFPEGPIDDKDSEFRYTVGSGKNGCDNTTPMGPRDFKIEIGLEKGVACRDSL